VFAEDAPGAQPPDEPGPDREVRHGKCD
jgi:hypothetical protein